MDIMKPQQIQVKTPLERELAKLRGYGDAKPFDAVDEFHYQADAQTGALGKGNRSLTQRSSSVDPYLNQPMLMQPISQNVYERAG